MSQQASKDIHVTGDPEFAGESSVERAMVVQSASPKDNSGEENSMEPAGQDATQSSLKSKKKKSKKARIKKALGVGGQDQGSASAPNPASKLTPGMMEQLLEMNPSLKGEVAGMTKEKAADVLKKLDVADLLTGMVCSLFLYNPIKLIEIIKVREWKKSERYGFI